MSANEIAWNVFNEVHANDPQPDYSDLGPYSKLKPRQGKIRRHRQPALRLVPSGPPKPLPGEITLQAFREMEAKKRGLSAATVIWRMSHRNDYPGLKVRTDHNFKFIAVDSIVTPAKERD